MNFVPLLVGLAWLVVIRLVLGLVPPLSDDQLAAIVRVAQWLRGMDPGHGLGNFFLTWFGRLLLILTVYLMIKAARRISIRFGSAMQ